MPSTSHQSGPSSTVTPQARRPLAIASMRSHSLTRSSLTPRITVRPVACAATTDSTGYSSIMLAARAGGTSMPRILGEYRARRSATGSPPSSRRFSYVRSAPISRSVSNRPARVGFRPMLGTSTSEPGTISAAQTGNAALEGSRGTTMVWARSSGWPVRVISRPSGVSTTEISAPKPASIRSVWSRVASFSITTVWPGAFKPASRTADLT